MCIARVDVRNVQVVIVDRFSLQSFANQGICLGRTSAEGVDHRRSSRELSEKMSRIGEKKKQLRCIQILPFLLQRERTENVNLVSVSDRLSIIIL